MRVRIESFFTGYCLQAKQRCNGSRSCVKKEIPVYQRLQAMSSITCIPRPVTVQKRTGLLRVLKGAVKAHGMNLEERALIVGGSAQDEQILRQAGFKHIVNSNLPTDMERLFRGETAPDTKHVAIDAEQIDLPSDSFDLVFASEVLHHCISPHKALCEMLRVSRKYVILMEPNDSFTMNALVKLNFSFPYELPAVIDHNYESGGFAIRRSPTSFIAGIVMRWLRLCLPVSPNESFRCTRTLIGTSALPNRTWI